MAKIARRLSVRWSKAREHGRSKLNDEMGDVLYEWGEGCGNSDGSLLHYHLGVGRMERDFSKPGGPWSQEPSLIEELVKRGYDLTTLKFSIRKKPLESATKPDAIDPVGAAPSASPSTREKESSL